MNTSQISHLEDGEMRQHSRLEGEGPPTREYHPVRQGRDQSTMPEGGAIRTLMSANVVIASFQ